VLATKLFPPSRRETLVARPRLADQLDTSLADNHHLTLVSAPAGFGKTTLLTAWLESLQQEHATVGAAWVSLDAGDNDPSRLLTHLAAALAAPGLSLDPAWAQQPPADGTAAMTALVNELAKAEQAAPDRHWVIVLDDYHAIDAAAVHESVRFLLDNLPRRAHLVIATRSDPLLPLARLRTRGQLVELRAADLRFTAPEARDFLNRVMGLDLTERDVEALEDRTEGWVAGLQLAALSLRNTTSAAETAQFIDAFTGSNRFVVDYLLDEVLARLSETEHQFLLRTSLLDRLTGSLCDALTESSSGAATLERLERDNLFVVALDTDRTWFRYHHLFADVLKARLLAEQPELVPSLHRAASAWYADHDLAPDAVNHALAGGDARRAAYLVEQALPQTRRARHDTTLLNWVAALPQDVVRTSPVLSILSGWSAMMTGNLEAMQARLDEADAALALGAHDPSVAAGWAQTEDLRTAPATVHVYRAALAQACGDVASIVQQAQQALALAGPEDHFVRGAAGGFLGMAAWAVGDVHQALSTFTQAARDLRAAGNHVDALDTSIVLGSMWLTAGQPSQARRTYEQALAAATANGEPYPRATPDLHVGLAELDVERGDLTAAQHHLDIASALGERTSITENRYRWYTVNAQLHLARGDHATALHLLGEAQEAYLPGAYPDIHPIPAMRARANIAAGNLDDAQQWAQEHQVSLEDDVTFLHEYDQLTLVRLRLAQPHSTPALTQVLQTLERVHAAANSGRAGTALEVGMLQALTMHAMGQHDEALAQLDQALTQAPEPDQYARLFLAEGAPMLALLHAGGADQDDRSSVAVLARRLSQVTTATAEPEPSAPDDGETTSAAAPLVDPLSDREVEVLRLLNSELTGPEIAAHLYVSLNTLRTHTKRIFTKLGVRNRAGAVRRGRELNLL
jgi:LuxR family maltose regulon positive regulatory protein